jgi:hypothetical protein
MQCLCLKEISYSDPSSPSLLKWVEFVRRVKVLPNLILLPLNL